MNSIDSSLPSLGRGSGLRTRTEGPQTTGTAAVAPSVEAAAAPSPKPTAVAPPARSESPPAVDQDIAATVEHLNELMQDIRRELRFSVDNESGRTIIKVVDVSTQEIVRQIPPEEAVRVIQNLESMQAHLTAAISA